MKTWLQALIVCGLLLVPALVTAEEAPSWPPPLPNAKDGTVTVKSDTLLEVPANVQAARKDAGFEFVVAAKPPTIAFAYHRDLGPDAVNRRLWSSWGDIGLASDGKVYCAIGDHGNDTGGDARCFVYVWDPVKQTLEQIVDMNKVVPPQKGQPAWSKVHAKIDEGPDGKILFCCTLNDGNRAGKLKWTEQLPGGQIYQYDPKSKQTSVFASLPPQRCTATSLFDRQRGIWWCTLEGGDHALWGLDVKTRKPVFQGPEKSVEFNRNFALARDGSIYFNGADGSLWKYDPAESRIVRTRTTFPDSSPGMRSSTAESKDGHIYGTTYRTGQLFRYSPAKDDLKVLGPAWFKGNDYITVAALSPDERFVYYLPGAHGKAFKDGTPVIQYDIASGNRKVLAFLVKAFEQETGYVPAGTYGMKLSADGGTMYVNFNGHPTDKLRPKNIKPIGFGLTGFAAINIPASER